MASTYPAALDTFATNKANATATTTDHPAHHNDLADAVNKIEAELGINPSAGFATVLARLNGIKVVRKTATESVTSSTTLQNDDELLFAIAANENWAVLAVLMTDGATGGDIKAGFAVPAGATGWTGVMGVGTAQTAFENAQTNNQADPAFGTGFPAGTLGANNQTVVLLLGFVDNDSTAGNVQVQWAQVASDGTATRVFADSYLLGFQVA